MEEIIPSSVIPYTNEMVVAELAGMYADVGEKDKGGEMISQVDISRMSLSKQTRFLMYSASRGYGDHSLELLEKITGNISRLPESRNKYEKFFELYAGFVKLEENALTDKIADITLKSILNTKNTELRSSLMKEYAVLVYQGGDSEYAAEVMNRYLELNPEEIEGLDLLFQIYQLSGNYEKALDTAERYLKLKPEDVEYLKQKSELETKLNKK
jgi:tetratricopeptide (TPR) repeat protein